MITDIGRHEAFAEARASFAAAAAGGAIHERTVRIAGESVQFRYADRWLADDLGAAFVQHPPSDDEPGLVVLAWESARSGAPPPRVGPEALDGGVGAEARISGPQPVEWRADPLRGITSLYDRDAAIGAFHVAEVADLPHWERSSPFRQILAWHLRRRDVHLLHGAALGNAESGVLLVGRGGSGKSSSALACLASPAPGLGFAGDDYCAVDLGGDPERVVAWSLFCTAKVGWGQLAFFPELDRFVVNGDRAEIDEKALLRFNGPAAPTVVDSVAVRAVVVPTVDPGAPTTIEPVGRPEALRALAPSSLFQLAGPNAEDFRALAAFVGSRPAFRLRLGGDPRAVPPLLADLVAELGR